MNPQKLPCFLYTKIAHRDTQERVSHPVRRYAQLLSIRGNGVHYHKRIYIFISFALFIFVLIFDGIKCLCSYVG